MGPLSENDLKQAAEFREEIHAQALQIVKALHPEIDEIFDPHSVDEYFQEMWDYPGAWYTIVAIPKGYKSRKALVDTLVKLTLEYYSVI